MSSKEPDARIRIDKMLIEAGWKLPGWSKDEEIKNFILKLSDSQWHKE